MTNLFADRESDNVPAKSAAGTNYLSFANSKNLEKSQKLFMEIS